MASDRIGISVSELNLMVAEAVRKDPRTRSLAVHGEISGFRHHIASGHWYFSLKDEQSSVSCVMFRTHTFRAPFRPADGMSVIVTGYVDVYPRNGSYQLYVTSLQAAGIGALYVQFEELKRRLSAEGLFDPARKKPLPMLPRKVAVVTSQSGAAIHDILNVSGQRSPAVPIVLIPVTVQGPGAGDEIARGIRRAGSLKDVDVIIVGRGGGSQEDLWCFNEEAVARAVADSPVPVVSGVGHEIDMTICDYAADVRASTPSNAAELVFPDRRELSGRIRALRAELRQAMSRELRSREYRIGRVRERLNLLNPEKRVQHLTAQSRILTEQLAHAMHARLERAVINRKQLETGLQTAGRRCAEQLAFRLSQQRLRLEALSPLSVLNRGYAMIYSEERRVISAAREAERHRNMTMRFADGEVSVIREDQSSHE